MKGGLKIKMKNELTFNIPDKFLVNLKFKDKLSLLDVCELKDLINANIPAHLFKLYELSDEELIEYYNKTDEFDVETDDFDLWLSRQSFDLFDMTYDYAHKDNKLQVIGKLIYNSSMNLFNGKGKFVIDFIAIFILPDTITGKIKIDEFFMTVRAGENKTSTRLIEGLIDEMSLIDFGSDQCNGEMPNNVYIVPGPDPVPNIIPSYPNTNKHSKLGNMF